MLKALRLARGNGARTALDNGARTALDIDYRPNLLLGAEIPLEQCLRDAGEIGFDGIDPEGGVDFAPGLKTAAEHGYSGWVVIEAEQDPAQRNPRACQTLGLQTVRRLAREAGLDRG